MTMTIKTFAAEMRGLVAPQLSEPEMDFLDSYFAAGEWEVVIELAARTAIQDGLEIPAEMSSHLDALDPEEAEDIRPHITP